MNIRFLISNILSALLLLTSCPAFAESEPTEQTPLENLQGSCDQGMFYSQTLKKCLYGTDFERVEHANNKCKAMEDGQEKDNCFAEVQKFDTASGNPKNPADEAKNKIQNSSVAKAEMAVNAAAAVYGAIQFFQAGSVTAAFNSLMTCTSAPLGLAASITVVVTRATLKKEVEAKLQAVKKEFQVIEELKGKEGLTYEVQVMAMKYYIRALDVSIEIAEMHEKTYKMNAVMYGLVTGIAAYEMATGKALMSYPPSAATGAAILKCATTAAIGAGVGLGFATLLLNTANKMKKKYQSDRSKIQTILARYEERFKNTGGLASAINSPGNEAQVNILHKTNALNTSSPNEVISATQLDGSQTSSSSRPGACADAEAKLDENCERCETNGKNCMSFPSLTSFSAELQSFAGKSGYDQVMSDGNKILSGKLDASSLSSNAVDAKYKRMRQVNTALFKHLKKKGVKQEQLDALDPQIALNNYMKKNADKIKKFSETASDPFAVKGLENMNIGNYIKNEELASEMKHHQKQLKSPIAEYQASKFPTYKSKFKGSDIDFGKEVLADDGLKEDDAIAPTNEKEMLELAKKANMDAGEYGPGVILDSNLSIFKTISNRYNVLRLKKRFSRDRSRSRSQAQ